MNAKMSKRILVFVLLACTLTLSAGCGKKEEAEPESEVVEVQETAVVEEEPESEDETPEPEEVTMEMQTEPQEETAEETAEEEETGFTVYYPDEEAIGSLQEEVDEEVSLYNIQQELVANGVISDEVMIISMEETTINGEKAIIVDMSEGFGDYIVAHGTNAETLVHDCLVNTLLSAYDATYVKFTEAGGDPVSTERGTWDFESYAQM